jgi:hypothetical protein
MLCIAHVSWGKEDFAGAILGAEGIDDHALSAEEAAEGFKRSTFEACFEF